MISFLSTQTFGLCTVDLHAFNWGNGGLGTGRTEKNSDKNAFPSKTVVNF